MLINNSSLQSAFTAHHNFSFQYCQHQDLLKTNKVMEEGGEQPNRAEREAEREAQRARYQLQVYRTSDEQGEFENELGEISLRDLLVEDCELQLDFKYIVLQLLRIIQPESTKSGAIMKSRYNKGYSNKKTTEIEYTRMYLCRVLSTTSPSDSRACVYLVQSKKENSILWKGLHELRDNGVLSIGTIFRLHAPLPVENMIQDVPVLQSDTSATILREPEAYQTTPIYSSINTNTCYAFTLNNVKVKILRTTVLETPCGGLFCDMARASEREVKKCSCFTHVTTRSNLAIVHDIQIQSDSVNIKQQGYCSLKFSQLYLNRRFPATVQQSAFHGTTTFVNLYKRVNSCVKEVNDDPDGFTAIGWYRRGEVNDRLLTGLVDLEGKVEGDCNYHINRLIPGNRNFLDSNHAKGAALNGKKFDVDSLIL